MTRPAYYNESDGYAAQVLLERVQEGWLPPGRVDHRDIRHVDPLELRGYGQVHLFAGIGGGGLACRLAGVPDDFPIITAGVPCQPASGAGEQKGRDDERWLWPEALNVLRALGSHVALLENPPSLLALHDGREFGDILAELAALGRAVEWDCVPAAAVGAPHQRDRLWLIAYPHGWRSCVERAAGTSGEASLADWDGAHWPVANADGGDEPERLHDRRPDEGGATEPSGAGEGDDVTDADRDGPSHGERQEAPGGLWSAGEASLAGFARRSRTWWAVEPDVGRVAHGVPARVDRLRALGNAWVPQAAVPALRVILARLGAEASA